MDFLGLSFGHCSWLSRDSPLALITMVPHENKGWKSNENALRACCDNTVALAYCAHDISSPSTQMKPRVGYVFAQLQFPECDWEHIARNQTCLFFLLGLGNMQLQWQVFSACWFGLWSPQPNLMSKWPVTSSAHNSNITVMQVASTIRHHLQSQVAELCYFARILLVATPPEQVKPNTDSTWAACAMRSSFLKQSYI